MMKPWFRKKQSKFSDKIREDVFFDCGDDRDPWASSAIDFFSRNKTVKKNDYEKESPVLSRSSSQYVDHMDPISFPQLNASYEKIRKDRLKYEQEEKKSSDIERRLPLSSVHVKIKEDVNGAEFENMPSLNAFSPHASKTPDSNEESSYKEIKFDPKQRLFEVGGLKASMRTSYTNSFQKLNLEAPNNPKITVSNSTVKSAKLESQPLEKKLENDHPSVIKIILISLILVFVIGILWLIYSQNDYEEGEVMVINAPPMIKIKPEKASKPLVPYQDELVYGKLEDFDETDAEGEQILPQTEFAPPPPEIEEKNDLKEEFSEYLEYPNSPKEEKVDVVQDEEIIDIRAEGTQRKPKSSVSSSRMTHQPEQKPKPLTKTFPYSRVAEKPVKAISEVPALKPSRKMFFVQLGTLPSKEMAAVEMKRLRSKYRILSSCGLVARQFQLENREKVYRILAGPFLSKEQALKLKQILGAKYRVIE